MFKDRNCLAQKKETVAFRKKYSKKRIMEISESFLFLPMFCFNIMFLTLISKFIQKIEIELTCNHCKLLILRIFQRWNRINVMRPNCALDRRTILCIYVPGLQRHVFKQVPNYKWIPPRKFQWIPRTNFCNATIVGTLVLVRIPQRASLGSFSGSHKYKRIPRM